MSISGIVCDKEKFKRLMEFDQICPKCQTSQHIHKRQATTFTMDPVTMDGSMSTDVIQNNYMCPVCGSSWKGLPHAKENKKFPEKYMIFLRLSDLYRCDLSFYEITLGAWFIIGLIITILLLGLSR